MIRISMVFIIVMFVSGSCGQWVAVDPSERDIEPQEIEEKDADDRYVLVDVRGHYIRGFESSYFYPCGSGESWWVSGNEELARRYYDVSTTINERVFVRLSGLRSELGRYGHIGGADRSFKVQRVIEIRKQADRDCN